jgi:hypothetical protein
MYIYAELSPRVSEGSNASRKYVLESGKSPEGVRSSGVNTESSGEVQNMESPYNFHHGKTTNNITNSYHI